MANKLYTAEWSQLGFGKQVQNFGGVLGAPVVSRSLLNDQTQVRGLRTEQDHNSPLQDTHSADTGPFTGAKARYAFCVCS